MSGRILLHMKILVVDDIAANRAVLRLELESAGYETFEAENGREALTLLERDSIDAVISDILMPVMDGYRLCLAVRNNEKLRRLPLIFYTSTYTAADDEAVARGVGADAFLAKPASAADIVNVLREVIGRERQAVSPGPAPPLEAALEGYTDRLIVRLEEINASLAREIAERKKTEQSLRRLSTAVEQTGDSVFITDSRGVIQFANPAFEKSTGYPKEEVVGRTPAILKSGHHDAEFYHRLWDTLLAGETFRGILVNRKKDGTLYFEEQTITPVRDRDDRVTHFVATGRDITMRIRAEEKVRDSELRYRMLFDASPIPMWVFDLETLAFLAVNDAAVEHYGYTRGEFLGMTIRDIRPPEDIPLLLDDIGEHGPRGVARGLWRHRLRDGELRDVEVVGHDTVFDGRTARLIVANDVTERKRAEDRLRKSEADLAEAQHLAKVGSWTYDVATQRITWSDETCRIFGADAKRPPLTYAEFLAFVDPADRPRTKGVNASTVRSGGPFDHEYTIVTPTGERKVIHELGRALRSSSGAVVGLFGTAQDITERKAAELALRESEQRLGLIAESIGEVFWMVDVADGTLLYISPAYERIWKKSREELYANPMGFLESVHPEDRDRVRGIFSTDRGGLPMSDEFRIVVPGGGIRWIWNRGVPAGSGKGEMSLIVGVAEDITARKEALEQLAESEQRFRSIYEYSPIGIQEVDAEGRIIRCNPAMCRMVGYGERELTGMRFMDLTHPDDMDAGVEALARLRSGEEDAVHIEKRYLKKNGEVIWVALTASAVRDGSGKLRNTVAAIQDVTAQKDLRKRLLQAEKMESLGTLAGGVAHDFNNILGIILSHASLGERGDLTQAELSRRLAAITRATDRGASLVKQLLTFARKSDVEREPLDVNGAVRDSVSLLHQTFPKTIVVETAFAPSAPSIVADATQFHQVLLNLAVNARDAMPRGGTLRIATSVVSADAVRQRFPGAGSFDHVCVEVTDTGSGMDEATKARAFEPFFTTKDPGKGTGLGLATVFGIVRAHEGHIDVESAPGEGTTFRLYFPLQTGTPGGEAPAFAAGGGLARGSESILLIEDEDDMRELMAETLSEYGYRVLSAGDGKEGVRLYAENRETIDLVVTDMGLPNMDGALVLESIRDINPEARVIIASGYVEPSMKVRLSGAGAADYIPKPYTPHVLFATIRRVLDTPLPPAGAR